MCSESFYSLLLYDQLIPSRLGADSLSSFVCCSHTGGDKRFAIAIAELPFLGCQSVASRAEEHLDILSVDGGTLVSGVRPNNDCSKGGEVVPKEELVHWPMHDS